jgi:DNA-binding transcriptional MerR regulator
MAREAASKKDDLLRLGDAARAAGVTVQQLQYYLMIGVVEPTEFSGGDQRLFDRRALKKIRVVRLLNDSGYSLRDIREIFTSSKSRRR